MLQNLLSKIMGSSAKVDYKQLIKDGAYVVDVRSPEEFRSGHPATAVNIPLDRIEKSVTLLKSKKQVILVCRSGARAGSAKSFLEKNGIANVINAGAWQNLN